MLKIAGKKLLYNSYYDPNAHKTQCEKKKNRSTKEAILITLF